LYVFVPSKVTGPIPFDRQCERINYPVFSQEDIHHYSEERTRDLGHTYGRGLGTIGKKDYSSGPFCSIADEYDGELMFNLEL
jgi:hypothetical protein